MPQRYEFSEEEKIVNSLESSNSSCSSRRTTSRVESVGTSKGKSGKRVDFTDDDVEVTHASIIDPNVFPPRVVKPKDNLRRPAARKMLIYPPKGQRGEPLILSKRRSKIRCRVNGDTGFRYEVEYLQTLVSDKWLPNERTNGPFRHHLDDDSTD